MSTNRAGRRVMRENEEELTTDSCGPHDTKLVSGYHTSTTESGYLSEVFSSSNISSSDDMRVSREIRTHSSDDLGSKSGRELYSRQDSGYIDRFSQLELSESSDNLDQTVDTPVKVQPEPVESLDRLRKQAFSQDEDGDTYLHVAIGDGFVEAVFSLVRLAPNPKFLDIRNNCWHTPLHIAVLTEQSLIVRRLVLAGASTSIRDKWGNTALHYAADRGDVACVLSLLNPIERADIQAVGGGVPHRLSYQALDIKNYQGQTCAHLAARNGHLDVLKHLWSYGADMNSREGLGGRTPLHFAVQTENVCVADLLLSCCKVDAEMENYAGMTPYQQAYLCDYPIKHDLARLGSLRKEVDLSSSDESDQEDMDTMYTSTPVMTAVSG